MSMCDNEQVPRFNENFIRRLNLWYLPKHSGGRVMLQYTLDGKNVCSNPTWNKLYELYLNPDVCDMYLMQNGCQIKDQIPCDKEMLRELLNLPDHGDTNGSTSKGEKMPEKIYTVKRTDETLLAPILARFIRNHENEKLCILSDAEANTQVLKLILNRYKIETYKIITYENLTEEYDHILWWQATMPEAEQKNIDCQNIQNKAKKTLIFFIPNTIKGEPAEPHPILDSVNAEEYSENPDVFERVERQICDRVKKSCWEISQNQIQPQNLSASQLTTFLSCPLKWLLEKYFGLKTPAEYTQNRDDETTTPGLLVHKVLELLFTENKKWEALAAAQRALEIFDGLTSGEIGPKENCSPQEREDFKKFPILGRNKSECQKIKQNLEPSVQRLVELLHENRLTIDNAEERFNNLDFEGIPFTGSIDLSLHDDAGHPFILDYKYSSSGKHYIEAARESRSLQLASYVWSKDPNFEKNLRSAYYIVPTKNFFLNPQDNIDVWGRVTESYRARLGQLNNGTIYTGLPTCSTKKQKEAREQKLSEFGQTLDCPPYCPGCEFKAICGKEENSREVEND